MTMTTNQAVSELVERVRAAAGTDDPQALREALATTLASLGVEPGHLAWTNGRDIMGAAYELLVPGHARRSLGQFFTPLALGRVMARWVLSDPRRLVIDPCCGSGALLVAVAKEDSRNTRLLGLDVDPLAVEMASANRHVRSIGRLELRRADFLVDDIGHRPDAVICNPPYTRHQELSATQKDTIHSVLRDGLGVRFSRLSSLHVLFLARALMVSSARARLAFVTPSHWLDMHYARELKSLLLAQAHVEAIISFPADQLVFDHARTTASITLITKGAAATDTPPTRLIRATGKSAESIAEALSDENAGERVILETGRKWSGRSRPTRRGVALGEVARVRRGVATGCNAFFVLSERDRRLFQISRSCVLPCVASPRLFTGDMLDRTALEALPETAPRWLFAPKRPAQAGPLANYLALGRTEFGVLDRYLVKQRVRSGRRWFDVETNVAAPILFSYLNRRQARFVRNEAGAVPLNNWLAISPHDDVDADALFALLIGGEVQERLRDDCRVYGSGLWKLEPSELKRTVLPTTLADLSR